MRALSILVLASTVLCFSSQRALAFEKYGNLLGCPVTDLTAEDTGGQSFLSFIKATVKPELEKYATRGYPVADGQRLLNTLEWVDNKVSRQVLSSVKGTTKTERLENLKKIGDQLKGKVANLHSLPQMIADTGLASDRYTLSTYIGLASCGGSSLKLADDNYAYNIHYGTGDEKKDQQTGRSFGASRVFRATDSSYSHYLTTLEEYVATDSENVQEFIKTIMETLTNSVTSNYEKVNDQGDGVLTDFFAIWTAEQTRNLMDGHVKLHWDAALLQVTLLSAFHAGQDKIVLFYKDPLSERVSFTDKTYELAWPRKNRQSQTCDVDLESRTTKDATLKDYIGVHYRTFEHCGRSGINMSRNEWKRLSKEITRYLLAKTTGRQKVEDVRRYIKGYVNLDLDENGREYREDDQDILREIARFLINDKTPDTIRDWRGLSKATAELLELVRIEANDITAEISDRYPNRLR